MTILPSKRKTSQDLLKGVKTTSRKVNTSVPQGSTISPLLFSLYIAYMPRSTETRKRVCYADNLTVCATWVKILDWDHCINSYPEEICFRVFCHVVQPGTPSQWVYLDTTLSFYKHTGYVEERVYSRCLKALAGISWGQQKETLLITYKAVGRLINYAAPVWSTKIRDTNYRNIHRLWWLPLAVIRCPVLTTCKNTTSITPLHKHTTYFNTPRLKHTIFNNDRYTTHYHRHPPVTTTFIKTNKRHIHPSIVSRHQARRGNNKILRTPLPHISGSKEILPRLTRRILAELITNKSPYLKSYVHKTTPNHIHHHYSPFQTPTQPTSSLQLFPHTELLARWTEKLAGGLLAGRSDFPHWKELREWVDNNNRPIITCATRTLGVSTYKSTRIKFTLYSSSLSMNWHMLVAKWKCLTNVASSDVIQIMQLYKTELVYFLFLTMKY